MLWKAPVEEEIFTSFLPSIVRLSISAFRAEDPGSNPGRSTNNYFQDLIKIGLNNFQLTLRTKIPSLLKLQKIINLSILN